MTQDPRHQALFTPYHIGSLDIANRIVMAPMTRNFSPGGVPGENVAAYYARRAAAGVGLIVTEGTLVPHRAANGYKRIPRFHGEDALAGWKHVVDAVHAEGGKIIPQLWHVGSVRQLGMEPDPAVPGFAPSAVPHPFYEGKGETPHAMSKDEIAEVIEAYAQAGANALALGFDGVEIHGAHGYLIDQFFWSRTNTRTDEYGGDLEGRTRFGREIVRAIRARTRPDFPIVLRFSQWKMGAYRERFLETPEMLGAFLAGFVEAGVDAFHPSTRRVVEAAFEGDPRTLAGHVKALSKKPTIGVGSVGLTQDLLRTNVGASVGNAPFDDAVALLEAGELDFIAVGRALLADATWAQKVRTGVADSARPYDKALERVLE
jgi:2,4-dienoyl-CoA reductase-like NADH-dependent reductase (Old Yellow Enzyme family)